MAISMRYLATLFLLSSLFLPGQANAFGSCSDGQAGRANYIGRAVLNEFETHNQSCASDARTFAEVKTLDQSLIINQIPSNWTLTLCAQAPLLDKDPQTTECITGSLDWHTAQPIGRSTYIPDLNFGSLWVANNDPNPNNPWLPIFFAQNQPLACYIDLNSGNKHGMEALLLDENGDAIDYLSVAGYNTIGDPGCNFLYGTTFAGGNNFNIARIPDGTGPWQNTGSGASGGDTADTTNDPITANAVDVTIADATALAGDPMVFNINFATPTISPTTIAYMTFDGSASAVDGDYTGVATWTQVTIPAGTSIWPISIPTSLTAAPTPGTFTLAINYVAGDIRILDQMATGTITAAPTFSSLVITPNTAVASTCAPTTVTVTAYDQYGAVMPSYTGSVSLSTSTGNGDWTSAIGNLGTFTAGPADSGQASYTFVAGDQGSASFQLSDFHSESLTITANDALSAVSATSGAFSFSDNMFVISDDGIRIAGRPISMSAELWTMERDAAGNPILDATGRPTGCQLVSSYNNTNQSLKAYLKLDVDQPTGAALPSINGTALPALTDPVNLASAATINLDFSDTTAAGGTAAGIASFNLDTTDVGKYTLFLADESGVFAPAVVVEGRSALMTVKPFAVGVEVYHTAADGTVTANPGGDATAGAAFIPAATNFSADIKAYLWQLADDANNDGVPDAGANVSDNGLVAAYAWDTTLSEQDPHTPGVYVAGNNYLSAPSLVVPAGSFAGGMATLNNLNYAEVGSFSLQAQAIGYLNTVGVDLTSLQVVGRFYPAYFSIDPATVILSPGIVTDPVANTGFSYLEQYSMSLSLTVTAHNALGVITSLYDNSAADPLIDYGFTAPTLGLVAENADDGNDLSARLAATTTLTWVGGTAQLSVTDLGMARDPLNFAEQFTALQFGAQVSDADGASLLIPGGQGMNAATAGDCSLANSCDAQLLGGLQEMRFARLVIDNAFGPESQDLAMPFQVQYYDASTGGFRVATDDNVSLYNMANTTITLNQTGGAFIGPAVDTAVITGQPDPTAQLTISGTGNPGKVEFDYDLTTQAWLRFDWDGDGNVNNDLVVSAVATFGSYRGNDHIIFWQELFN